VDGVEFGARAFGEKGRPAPIVLYQSQQNGLRFLRKVLVDTKGIGLLLGPESSGKSVIIRQFLHELPKNVAAADVDGSRLRATDFLTEVLDQFGYKVELKSSDELLNMLRVIVVQLTRSQLAPVLVVRNVNNMYPGALCILCKLASQMVKQRYALRIVLVSDRYFYRIMHSPSMEPITDRLAGKFELQPITAREAASYIYAKLHSLGVEHPDSLVPFELCARLHAASDGLPGVLDDILLAIVDQANVAPVCLDDIDHPALQHLAEKEDIPVLLKPREEKKLPRLIVTREGKTLQEVELTNSRALVGRSDLSDIVIESHFVSRQHALLVRNQGAVVLVDLKSRNGTFVNSRRVSSKVLLDSDIVMIGDHRIKMIYASASPSVSVGTPDTADTVKMKNIADARRAKLQEVPDVASVDKHKA
jgi:pSer/pThr/pTyr-binding forkhead associated (FHA) protein